MKATEAKNEMANVIKDIRKGNLTHKQGQVINAAVRNMVTISTAQLRHCQDRREEPDIAFLKEGNPRQKVKKPVARAAKRAVK